MRSTFIERLEGRVLLDASAVATTGAAMVQSTGAVMTASTAAVTAVALDNDSIQIDWKPRHSTPPPDGYRIYRRADGEAYYKIAEVTDTSYLDTYLSGGSKYFYKVF